MVKPFSKPQEARELEARARARQCRVKVVVATVARRYTTTSRTTGEAYTIERTPAGWACTCLGYFHTGCCKHLGAVERRAEREGWDFGAVAPLHRVERYFPLGAAAPAAPVVALPDRQARKAAALADLYGDVA